MADAGSGHQGGDTEFEDQDLEAVAGPDTSSGLRDTPLALDQVIKGMKMKHGRTENHPSGDPTECGDVPQRGESP